MKQKAYRLIVLFIFSLCVQNILCQDFNFNWTLHIGEFGDRYEVKISRINSKRKIEFAEVYPERSFEKKLEKTLCDSLYDFFIKYDFQKMPNVASHISRKKIEEFAYYDTISLSGTSKVLINGDSIYPEQLNHYSYYWDEDSSQFYQENSYYLENLCIGCPHMEGTFGSGDKLEHFDYYFPLDDLEIELIQFVMDIVGNYRKHIDLTAFEEDINKLISNRD